MGIKQDIAGDYHAALAALAWQIELGADEALGEDATSAYDLPEKPPYSLPSLVAGKSSVSQSTPAKPAAERPVAATVSAADALFAAQSAAARCTDLVALDAAAAAFDGCELRKGARGAVAGLGPAQAAVLVLCDPPTTEAERTGSAMPQTEAAFLARMFAEIGLSPTATDAGFALHLAPVLPWALRSTRDVQDAALRLMQPFVLRRIALVQPKRVVVMGHAAVFSLLGGVGMAQARGQFHRVEGIQALALPMQMPASIMRSPAAKREAWADLLALGSALRAD